MIMRQGTILIVKDNYVGNVHITKTYIKAFNFRIFWILVNLSELWHMHYSWPSYAAASVQLRYSPVSVHVYCRTWRQPNLSRGFQRIIPLMRGEQYDIYVLFEYQGHWKNNRKFLTHISKSTVTLNTYEYIQSFERHQPVCL